MGTIGNAIRFTSAIPKTGPGPGDYDLTNFKNFAKASETTFEMPKYSRVTTSPLNRSNRAQSAVNRTIDNG